MGAGQPSSVTAKRGDGSIYFQWSPATDANDYEVHISCPDTAETTIDRTTETSFTKIGLKNGLEYSAQIIARNDRSQSIPSEAVKLAPVKHQSSFEFFVKYEKHSDQISLTWTMIPTSSYYRIERCDVEQKNQFTRITTINDNTVSTFQDQISSKLCQFSCRGHYYRISVSVNKMLSDEARLSNKIFCRVKTGVHQCIFPQKEDDTDSDCSADSTSARYSVDETDSSKTTANDVKNATKNKLPTINDLKLKQGISDKNDTMTHDILVSE